MYLIIQLAFDLTKARIGFKSKTFSFRSQAHMILELPQFSEHTEHIIGLIMLSNSIFSNKWGESTRRQRAPKPLALRSSTIRWHIEPTHREHLGILSKANPRGKLGWRARATRSRTKRIQGPTHETNTA